MDDSPSQFLLDTLTEAFAWLADLLIANLLWAFFTLLVVTAPGAAAGMFYMTNRMAHDRPVTWRIFFEGFRRFFWLSWRWALMNLLALSVFYANVRFYGEMEADWAPWAQGIFLGLGLLWFLLQMYTFPMLLEGEDGRLVSALRNSVLLFARRPFFSLGMVLVMAVLAAISTAIQIPWLLITISFYGFLLNRATLYLLGRLPVILTPEQRPRRR
jgi:uncharacterized membrane protein YesL